MSEAQSYSHPHPSTGRLFSAVTTRWGQGALLAGAALLAVEPVLWLTNSWHDPSYESSGLWIFLACLGLALWAGLSPWRDGRHSGNAEEASMALALLFLAALLRALGQVLAVNVIAAMTLVIDIYALGRWVGLHRRVNAVSPFWLAVLFFLSLPVERIVQRLLGYALQQLSAEGACGVLGTMVDQVTCTGVRIVLDHRDVLVDQPCSGARGLTLLLTFYVFNQALHRQPAALALLGVGVTLLIGYTANVGRIVVLALGLAFPGSMPLGIDVMAQPWHDLIGLTFLGLAGAAVLGWGRVARILAARMDTGAIVGSGGATHRRQPLPERDRARLLPAPGGALMGLIFFALSLLVLALPRAPVDVSQGVDPLSLPVVMAGHRGVPVPLMAREQAYFTRYGGVAAKAQYGPFGLLMVRSAAPLRHLHDPGDCLRGLGFQVTYLGTRFAGFPSALYKATAPDGTAYRVAVSFRADDGRLAAHVSEAVWWWMAGGSRHWTMIQRISPWDLPGDDLTRWQAAVANILDLPLTDERSAR